MGTFSFANYTYVKTLVDTLNAPITDVQLKKRESGRTEKPFLSGGRPIFLSLAVHYFF